MSGLGDRDGVPSAAAALLLDRAFSTVDQHNNLFTQPPRGDQAGSAHSAKGAGPVFDRPSRPPAQRGAHASSHLTSGHLAREGT